MEDFRRVLGGINVGDQIIGIIIKQRLGFVLIGLEPPGDHFVAGVVETVFLEGAFAKPAVKFLTVWAGKVEDLEDFDVVLEDFCLLNIARNAVEDEEIDVWFEKVAVFAALNVGFPQFHREVVRDEFATGGVGDKLLPQRRAGIERAENIPAGTMHEPGNAPQNRALRAFATTRRAEDQEGSIAEGRAHDGFILEESGGEYHFKLLEWGGTL